MTVPALRLPTGHRLINGRVVVSPHLADPVPIETYVSRSLAEWLDERAAAEHVSRSTLIRMLLTAAAQ